MTNQSRDLMCLTLSEPLIPCLSLSLPLKTSEILLRGSQLSPLTVVPQWNHVFEGLHAGETGPLSMALIWRLP